jgi:hypothetical protein
VTVVCQGRRELKDRVQIVVRGKVSEEIEGERRILTEEEIRGIWSGGEIKERERQRGIGSGGEIKEGREREM